MPIKSIQTHTVTITGYNSGGEGVSRLDDGRVVFIRGAARGDILEIVLTKELSRSTCADIIRIISPSPYRIEPDCKVFPQCGGCDYRHIDYNEELYAKQQCVNDALKRIGGLSVQINEVLHTRQINGYRNKVVLHSDGAASGFYRSKSHDVVPVENCLLLKDEINKEIKCLTKTGIKQKCDITIRSGRNGTIPPFEEELDGLIFKLEGFFQVNTKAALILFQKAREYAALSKSDTLIDLYCGVGAMTLFTGRDAGHALGIEQNPDAVKIAKENAKRNNLTHLEFLNADASSQINSITTPDCVIVDPPRNGLSKDATNRLLELFPKRLVYVSCNPATLARDIKNLNGYKIKEICAVDMFPRTANIECCCLLVKE